MNDIKDNAFTRAYKNIDSNIHKYEKEERLYYDPNGCEKVIVFKRKEK